MLYLFKALEITQRMLIGRRFWMEFKELFFFIGIRDFRSRSAVITGFVSKLSSRQSL